LNRILDKVKFEAVRQRLTWAMNNSWRGKQFCAWGSKENAIIPEREINS
jgi:hypothetical protein